jgi:hypothetical protein
MKMVAYEHGHNPPHYPIMMEQLRWYLANKDTLIRAYNGKFLIIVDKKVAGVYDDSKSAHSDFLKKYTLGEGIIHECLPIESAFFCGTPGVSGLDINPPNN